MTGLEKIIERIRAEARADAAATLRAAEEKCAVIRKEYRRRAEETEEQLRSEARREGERIVTRARSGAEMSKRNIMLGAQAETLDAIYREAYGELLALPEQAYEELLVRLLSEALIACATERAIRLEQYGEEQAIEEPECYEVLLNASDRAKYGDRLLTDTRRAVVGKLEAGILDRLVLAKEPVQIDGGIILRHGDVETNCSLEMVFADARERTEAEVSRMLFT